MIGAFAYHRPTSASAVDELLAQEPNARVFAGGTDLMVAFRSEGFEGRLVDVTAAEGLDVIAQPSSGGLRVGAATRLSAIRSNRAVLVGYRALAEGAATVGSRQIQNMATLVGNVCNASPAADTAPALLVFGAAMNLSCATSSRRVPAREFWTGPRQTVVAPGEWVESIDLPAQSDHGSAYVKLGRTRGVDLALTGAAAVVTAEFVRLAFASMAPTPVLAPTAARVFEDGGLEPDDSAVADALRRDLSPIGDLRASEIYRHEMAIVAAQRAVETARARFEAL